MTHIMCYDSEMVVRDVSIIYADSFEKRVLKVNQQHESHSIITYWYVSLVFIPPINIFQNAIEDVNVYDLDGNVILTKEDIENDLVNSMDNKYRFQITNETIESGRIKHKGLAPE